MMRPAPREEKSMSASASMITRKLPRGPVVRVSDPPRLRAFELAVTAIGVGAFISLSLGQWRQIVADAPTLAVWLLILVTIDLLPVRYPGHLMTMSVAVLLAAGMVHSPAEVGLLALVGSVDIREIRREIGIERALFNRSQVALSSMAASVVFHGAAGSVATWPQALLGALLAVTTDAVINLVLVSLAAAIAKGRLFPNAPHYLFREMLLSSPGEYVLSYVGLGLLALLFASAYAHIGLWGLASTLVPVLLVRQAFVNRERTVEAEAEVAEAHRKLQEVDGRVEEERRTERERIAADLHDEVLPALFKVHLMGQVLKQDVGVGRLLDLDEDLPQLLEATEYAAARMRALISTLRRNTSQVGAVTPTLALLVQDLKKETPAALVLSVEDVGASPLVQLLIFQIAREALRNAIRHAEASNIHISLARNGLYAELRVTDDGKGFCIDAVDPGNHFGLALMADRAKIGGGKLEIVSSDNAGTTVLVHLPLDAPLP